MLPRLAFIKRGVPIQIAICKQATYQNITVKVNTSWPMYDCNSLGPIALSLLAVAAKDFPNLMESVGRKRS